MAKSESVNTAAAKMVEAMGEIGYVQKDKANAHHKYRYLSEEATKRAVQAACIKVGLALSTTINIVTGDLQHFVCKAVVTFLDPVTGHTVEVEGMGQGKDNTDKALMKAQTAAVRECLKNAFSIPAGTDPEGDPATDKPATKKAAPKKAAVPAVKLLTEEQFEDKMNLIGAHIGDCTEVGQLDKAIVGLETYLSSKGVSAKTTTMHESMVAFVQTKREELTDGK